jgi:uncharacterized protein YlxW (UPF0749 family)
VVFLLAGILFVASAVSSGGTDLRAGRYDDLGTLVGRQKAEADALVGEANRLAEEVERLSAGVADNTVERTQAQVEAVRGPAGLDPVRGPGVTVTLDDAPKEVIDASDGDVNDLVVHQQDIQAVVNALWSGGAEAMTIQGQRVISTTGIKCVGNTVRLHGIPYSPPYVVTAVGSTASMLASVDASPAIDIYEQYVERFGLGWDVATVPVVRLPGYEGSLDLAYAQAAG